MGGIIPPKHLARRLAYNQYSISAYVFCIFKDYFAFEYVNQIIYRCFIFLAVFLPLCTLTYFLSDLHPSFCRDLAWCEVVPRDRPSLVALFSGSRPQHHTSEQDGSTEAAPPFRRLQEGNFWCLEIIPSSVIHRATPCGLSQRLQYFLSAQLR